MACKDAKPPNNLTNDKNDAVILLQFSNSEDFGIKEQGFPVVKTCVMFLKLRFVSIKLLIAFLKNLCFVHRKFNQV